MDWYLDTGEAAAATELRRAIRGYLERHAEPGSDVDAAELVAAELMANALRHGRSPAWVRLDWTAEQPVLEVHDLGPSFELRPGAPDRDSPGGRGLLIAASLSPELTVAAKAAGGAKVTAVLPVRRRLEPSHDPRPHLHAALPAPEEADADGAFGKEPFLRALVVQLGAAVEAQQGPDAAAAAVAQVGADVGGRMEEAYRAARNLVGALTVEQIADLYVRLKAAIDGDFYVIEADEQHIVLGNRACPFGDVVKRAPGLCRMTSSVFGGIAARNRGGASVLLEERIAIGDPECRVVVWLGGEQAGRVGAHRYGAQGG